MGRHWTELFSWITAGNKRNYRKSPLAEDSTEERQQSELPWEGETQGLCPPGVFHWM